MPTHPGRNEPCPCGSGKKYKHCCLAKNEAAEREKLAAEAKQASTATTTETATQAAAPPRATRPPKHKTRQPWKRTEARGPMFNIPRRSGGS